jgi:UTP--glucose-1-phosphate uridylyltransferase
MSQDGASQFQEVIRQELELSVKKELEKILTTASSHEFEVRTLQCFCFVYQHT